MLTGARSRWPSRRAGCVGKRRRPRRASTRAVRGEKLIDSDLCHGRHQQCCGAVLCRRASRAASQSAWLARPAKPDWFNCAPCMLGWQARLQAQMLLADGDYDVDFIHEDMKRRGGAAMILTERRRKVQLWRSILPSHLCTAQHGRTLRQQAQKRPPSRNPIRQNPVSCPGSTQPVAIRL